MDFCVVVPARLASTRLPDKPLADLGGRPMLLHVLDRASQSGAKRVIAATDSPQLEKLAVAAGFEAVLTGECDNGTQRVAEAARLLSLDGVVVNLQGDEPEMDPQTIRATAQLAAGCDCASAAAEISQEQAQDPGLVKVVVDSSSAALYFSRAAIPRQAAPAGRPAALLGHLGIYAFAPGRLQQAAAFAPCALDRAENLEQLRWLWHGWKIRMAIAARFTHGIDTHDDLQAARARLGDQQ